MKTKTGTIQIIAIVLALVTLVFISAMWYSHKSILAVDLAQEDLRAYVGIVSKKAPEYAATALEKGAYQAIYEVGLRGGFRKDTTFSRKNISVLYESTNVSTAIWREYGDVSNIPSFLINFQYDLSKVTEKIVKDTLARYAPMYDLDVSDYNTAMYTVLRVPCGIEYGADNNNRCLDANITGVKTLNKKYTVSNTKIADAFVFGETYERISVRLPGMYDLMDNFMRNNFPARAGTGGVSTGSNTLSAQLEESAVCYGAGCQGDWASASKIVQYAPGQNNCDFSSQGSYSSIGDAKVNYACCPSLQTPACKEKIQENFKNAIQQIDAKINEPSTASDTNVICPPDTPGCEPEYAPANSVGAIGLNITIDPYTSQTYKQERFRWILRPAAPSTWQDIIKWSGTDDRYTILWWNQSNTAPEYGKCYLPGGYNFLTDSQPEESQVSGFDATHNINQFYERALGTNAQLTDKNNYPEGTACCDTEFTNCHDVRYYVTQYGSSSWSNCCGGSSGNCYTSGEQWGTCEDDSAKTDPAHNPPYCATAGGCPAGDGWCSQVNSVYHWTSHPGCGCCCTCSWGDPCCCGTTRNQCESTTQARIDKGHAYYTHCDIRYTTYGHFKYRADIDPLLVTIADESKIIPIEDIYGNDANAKPSLNAIYQETIREEPKQNDRCTDVEGDENTTRSRYYPNPLPGDTDKNECPRTKNVLAPSADNVKPGGYYSEGACACTPGTCNLVVQKYCSGGHFVGEPDYCNNCKTSPTSHCQDGVKNCDETAVDCGGADCGVCLTCTSTPPLDCSAYSGCCGVSNSGVDECSAGLDVVGDDCRSSCECASGYCNPLNKCEDASVVCGARTTITSTSPYEYTLPSRTSCPLNIDIEFNTTSGVEFKVEAIYSNGTNTITEELCRSGGACKGTISQTTISANLACGKKYTYMFSGYNPWLCTSTSPVPVGYKFSNITLTPLSGTINAYALTATIGPHATEKPVCGECGGTAYWMGLPLQARPTSGCSAGAGTLADVQSLINCVTNHPNIVISDSNSNQQYENTEIAPCCDATPPTITLEDPVGYSCGQKKDFGSTACSFNLNVSTNEDARCRWKSTDASYNSMTNDMDGDFETYHSQAQTLLNEIADYFISCKDRTDNANPSGATCKFTANCTG